MLVLVGCLLFVLTLLSPLSSDWGRVARTTGDRQTEGLRVKGQTRWVPKEGKLAGRLPKGNADYVIKSPQSG